MSRLGALAVWFLIILCESILGTLRQLFVVPVVGDLRARQAGVLIGSVVIFAIAGASIRWINPRSFAEQMKVGLLWVVLTVIFEIGFGLILGYPPERILSDYNPAQGGFLGLGLLFMLFAPALAVRVRGSGPGPVVTIGQKILMGVVLPLFLTTLVLVVVTLSWPPGPGPAGQTLAALFIVVFHIAVTSVLNLWLLPVKWRKTCHCFLGGMGVPVVALVLELLWFFRS